MNMRTITSLVAAALLAGCASSPKSKFYVLSVVPGHSEHARLSAPVQLAAVHIPPSLDRRQMVRLTTENRVAISETDRWAAPFDEMVRNVLSQDLAARFPNGSVILPQAPAPDGTRALVVTIVQFGPDTAGIVRLRGSWALLDEVTGAVRREHDFRFDAGPATQPNETAAAMSQALGRLSAAIAAAL
jgi:uncharacterized lipoprotein YmbA